MRCQSPVKMHVNGNEVERGCGQCIPCRVTKRRSKAIRIMLEAQEHSLVSFVTLTYNNLFHPPSGSLIKEDIQGFLNRLRSNIYPRKFRYVAVGEYGEKYKRPHFHLVMFGIGCNLNDEYEVKRAWSIKKVPIGLIEISELTKGRAEYVAKYTLKSTESYLREHPGLAKEFSLWSRRPGIGSTSLQKLGEQMKRKNIVSSGFGPSMEKLKQSESISNQPILESSSNSIRYNGQLWPLDRFAKEKVFPDVGVLTSSQRTKVYQDNKYLSIMGDPCRDLVEALIAWDRKQLFEAKRRRRDAQKERQL